jgi:hypothetical protein
MAPDARREEASLADRLAARSLTSSSNGSTPSRPALRFLTMASLMWQA